MSDKGEPQIPAVTESAPIDGKAVSRREFLKLAGVAGAAVGMGAGLGGLLAACGGETSTTTAASEATTATTAATSSTASSETTATSAVTSAEQGRELKVGYVLPTTGSYASMAIPSGWIMDHWKEVLPKGVIAGDGKSHMIKVEKVDTQSDSNRAAQVTGDLIMNSNVDVVMAAGGNETCNPSADQAEAGATPFICTNVPTESWFFGRGGTIDKPFKYTWAVAASFFALVGSWIDMWDQLATNKKVGLFFTNDTSGLAFSDPNNGVPFYCKERGYEYVLPGLVNPGGEDYTSVIGEFKKAGCEICATIATPPEFTNMWSQSFQQGFKPKIMTAGLALIFASTPEAIGPTADGLSCEDSWHPTWPYKETMSGWTNQQLADDYTAKTGNQWTVCLQQSLMMDVYVDALKRTKDVDNKDEVAAAMGATKMMTTQGPIDFTAPVGSHAHPVPNAATHSVSGGQWRKSKDPRWKFELNAMASTYMPQAEGMVTSKLEPIQYTT